MAEGVVLKLSTDAAVRSMSDFDRAALAAFRTMEQQSGVLKQLEQQFSRQAAAEEAAARAATAAAAARKRANDEAQRSFGIYGGNLNPGLASGLGGGSLTAQSDGLIVASKKAQEATDGVARSTAKAAPIVGRFANALGGSAGVSKALGAVGGAAQLFVGAINPLYIAVGLAAAAVGELAIKLATAESPLQKVRRQAQEAQASYDLLAESVGRASDAIEKAATTRRGQAETGSFANRFDAANQTLQGLKQAQSELDTAVGRGANAQTAPLTLPQISRLAEALGKTEDVIKAIGRLQTATGLEYDRALKTVRDGGIPIDGDRRQTNANSVSFQRGGLVIREQQGVVTLDPARAEEIIANALGEAATRVQQLLIQRAREQFQGEIRQLGERALQNLGPQREAGYQAARRFQAVGQGLDQQIALTGATGAERERLILEQRIREAQDGAGVVAGSLAGDQIAGKIRQLTEKEKTVRALEEIKDVGRDAFQTITSGIADAVVQGKNLRQALASIGPSLTSLLLNRALGAATNAIFGPSGGTPAPGGNGQLGRILPQRSLMGGGILDRAQTIVSGGYAINVAEGGGASPEAVIPLARDSYGRLGVRGEGGGGGVMVFNMPNVRTGADARAVRPTLSQTIEGVNRRGRRTLRAGR